MDIGEDGNYYDCFACGDGGELLCCEHCPEAYHIDCLAPPLQSVPEEDNWECPLCVKKRLAGHVPAASASGDLQPPPNNILAPEENHPIDDHTLGQSAGMEIGDDGANEPHFYECVICKDGGELLCCEQCPNTYHLKCLDRHLLRIPEGEWYCPECRRQRCEFCQFGGEMQFCDNCCDAYHWHCLDITWQERIVEERLEGSFCSPMCAAAKRADELYPLSLAVDVLLSMPKQGSSSMDED